MKKSNLRPFNKKTLKAVSLAVALGTLGCCTLNNQIKQVKHEREINTFKTELVNYVTNHVNELNHLAVDADGTKTLFISQKFPPLAIIYHHNGEITLNFNREYLSVETAMQRHPHLTAQIRQYINTPQITDSKQR